MLHCFRWKRENYIQDSFSDFVVAYLVKGQECAFQDPRDNLAASKCQRALCTLIGVSLCAKSSGAKLTKKGMLQWLGNDFQTFALFIRIFAAPLKLTTRIYWKTYIVKSNLQSRAEVIIIEKFTANTRCMIPKLSIATAT